MRMTSGQGICRCGDSGRTGIVGVSVLTVAILLCGIPVEVRAQMGGSPFFPPLFGPSGGSSESGPRGKAVTSGFAPTPTDVTPAPATRPRVPASLKSVQADRSALIAPAASPRLRLIARVDPLIPVAQESEDEIAGENGENGGADEAVKKSGEIPVGELAGEVQIGEISGKSPVTEHTSDGTGDSEGEDRLVEEGEGEEIAETGAETGETSPIPEESVSEVAEASAGGDGTGPTVHGPPRTVPDSDEVSSALPEDTGGPVESPQPAPGPDPVPESRTSENAEDTEDVGSVGEGTTGEPRTSVSPDSPQTPEFVEQTPDMYTLEQLLPLLREEMEEGLRSRGHDPIYQRYRSYIAERLIATTSRTSNFEMRGNCRLPWYEQMLRAPIAAPIEAERFSRELHT
ncbi:MAG: hypothetical protein Q4C47_08355, partial [Planctomycetia bacterium]|nr:hypothetical protein [Planctomycetia bacterium]